MKRILLALIYLGCMIFPAVVCAQSSGPTPPPPPTCSQMIAGQLYTETGTNPYTVYTCSYYNLAWQWVVNPSYGGLVYYPTVPSTCSGALPMFLAGWPNTQTYVCVNGVPDAIGGAESGVTNFSAPSGSWPTWLVPTVTNPTTTPSLAVTASTIPVNAGGTGATTAAGANLSITGVTQTGTLGTSSQVSTFPGTVAAATAVSSVNGEINAGASPYNMAPANSASANTADLTSAIAAAYSEKETLLIPAGYYYLNPGINLEGVALNCGYFPTTGAASSTPVTLNFSGSTSGIAFTNYNAINGCYIVGRFTAGNAVSGTISSISEVNGLVSVTFASAPSSAPIAGMSFNLDGTTNYNGTWRVLPNPTTTTLQFQRSMLSNAASETTGTVHYYPTVALQHFSDTVTNTATCCGVNLRNFAISGFGTALDMSSTQVSTLSGSTDNGIVENGYIFSSLIGVQMVGKGSWQDSASPIVHTNVSLNHFKNLSVSAAMTGINCGPPGGGGDSEGGCILNQFEKIDIETCDTNSADGTVLRPVVMSGLNNLLANSTIGCFAGSGQTVPNTQIDTSQGLGNSTIRAVNVAGTPSGGKLIKTLASDTIDSPGNGAAWGVAIKPGVSVSGDIVQTGGGTTLPPSSVTCIGSCTGSAVSYALVCNTPGGKMLPSAFVSSVSTTGSAAGPTSFSSSNYNLIRFSGDNRCLSYDLLIGNTSQSNQLAVNPGATGSNYIADETGTFSAYTPGVYDSSGVIKQNTINSANQNTLTNTLISGTLALNGGAGIVSDGSGGFYFYGPKATLGSCHLTSAGVLTCPNGYLFGWGAGKNFTSSGDGGIMASKYSQTAAATNFGTAISTQQTIVSSVPTTGILRVIVAVTQSTLGVGCGAGSNTATPTLTWTAANGTVETQALTALTISANGTLDSLQDDSLDAVAQASTSIHYTVASALVSTGCTTTPQYTVYAKAIE